MLDWKTLRPRELSTAVLYDILQLRSEVFVVEQTCIYQDIDGTDLEDGMIHLVGYDNSVQPPKLAAYARAYRSATSHSYNKPQPHIGRIIVAPSARKGGLGKVLVERISQVCTNEWPGEPIVAGAQAHLAKFYGSCGYAPRPDSKIFLEDGIEHIDLERPADWKSSD